LHPKATVDTFVQQLTNLELTHLIVQPTLATTPRPSFGISHLTERLVKAGCAEVLARVPARNVFSRTMGVWKPSSADVVALRWDDPNCTLGRGGW
jgi:hypothetical protein